MEYSPPPLFKQGASARAKVVFFSLIALILLVADSRLRSLGTVRQVVGTALYPLQVAAMLPRDAANMAGSYFTSLSSLERENRSLKQEKVGNAQTLQQAQQLAAENDQLRKLLAANERVPMKSIMSEILYDARDAFTRKIVLDRGTRQGVALGQPVIDDSGVVGQVTRVFPFTAEVTLLTDKDQAIPVQVVRSGLRSIAYGQGHSGSLDLRFMPTNADIKSGDTLVTSGIDGVYPAGLAVAKVTNVETKSSDAFARITCQPLAGVDRNRQLLILLAENKLPPRPEPEDPKEFKKEKGKKRAAEMKEVKDPKKEGAGPAPADQAAAPDNGQGAAAATAAATATSGATKPASPAKSPEPAGAKAGALPKSPPSQPAAGGNVAAPANAKPAAIIPATPATPATTRPAAATPATAAPKPQAATGGATAAKPATPSQQTQQVQQKPAGATQ
jgi:rod shape-determining protein MreC